VAKRQYNKKQRNMIKTAKKGGLPHKNLLVVEDCCTVGHLRMRKMLDANIPIVASSLVFIISLSWAICPKSAFKLFILYVIKYPLIINEGKVSKISFSLISCFLIKN